MRTNYYNAIVLIALCIMYTSCTKVSYRSFTCECTIIDVDNNTTKREYGVQESSKINALPLCRDIENRLEDQNNKEGVTETVNCNIQ